MTENIHDMSIPTKSDMPNRLVMFSESLEIKIKLKSQFHSKKRQVAGIDFKENFLLYMSLVRYIY